MSNIWKTINGYSRYEVSEDGKVRKKKLAGGYRIINPWLSDNHYKIELTDDYQQRRRIYLHRLVLVTYGPEQPSDKPLALHRDDDPANNHIDNIVWGDKSDNGKMAAQNGKLRPFADHKFLTMAEAEQVRSLRSHGLSMSRIAREFGCSRWTVANILNNKIKRLAA